MNRCNSCLQITCTYEAVLLPRCFISLNGLCIKYITSRIASGKLKGGGKRSKVDRKRILCLHRHSTPGCMIFHRMLRMATEQANVDWKRKFHSIFTYRNLAFIECLHSSAKFSRFQSDSGCKWILSAGYQVGGILICCHYYQVQRLLTPININRWSCVFARLLNERIEEHQRILSKRTMCY